ncbi:IS66 family transposase [Deinococcus peraridilitoris]|uniref:IS66 family transposase n=1 Tax=Deinococcus peraridilitoris TaxID=432329 RepID=UPI003CCB8F94
MEPTNNAAERALRPAVIARKVSQCSKTTAGSQAFAIFKSLTQTARLLGLDPLQFLLDHPLSQNTR